MKLQREQTPAVRGSGLAVDEDAGDDGDRRGGRQEQDLAVEIVAENAVLNGDLRIPAGVSGVVLFAHGSGSGRTSPRNQFVARALEQRGMATLLLDLLTEEEEVRERLGAELRFDIDLLTRRLLGAMEWLNEQSELRRMKIGVFGASTGAAAALAAAAENPAIGAVVSRGGRPDMASAALEHVEIPVLLMVGSQDRKVLTFNRQALARLPGEKRLEVIAGASHLFEEPGALEEVARMAADWFARHLGRHRMTIRAA